MALQRLQWKRCACCRLANGAPHQLCQMPGTERLGFRCGNPGRRMEMHAVHARRFCRNGRRSSPTCVCGGNSTTR